MRDFCPDALGFTSDRAAGNATADEDKTLRAPEETTRTARSAFLGAVRNVSRAANGGMRLAAAGRGARACDGGFDGWLSRVRGPRGGVTPIFHDCNINPTEGSGSTSKPGSTSPAETDRPWNRLSDPKRREITRGRQRSRRALLPVASCLVTGANRLSVWEPQTDVSAAATVMRIAGADPSRAISTNPSRRYNCLADPGNACCRERAVV